VGITKPMLLTYPADPADPTLRAAFFAPLEALFAAGKLASTRPCPELSDQTFVQIGVQRVLDLVASGRDFLQRLRELFSMTIGRSNFFAACNSARRLKLVREVNEQLQAAALAELRRHRDPLASIAELNGREVWAGDGTCLAHACHDPRDAEGSYLSVKHIFSIDLRASWCRVLCAFASAEPRRHEVKSLKENGAAALRLGGQKGIIHVYDRAVIDFGFWRRQKIAFGIYFISRNKENIAPVHRLAQAVDHQDPRNAGVLKDERIGMNNQGEFRLITYQDAETGEIFEFLTSDMTLPPGVIVHLYRLRWNIEKVFDQFKNKLAETKAWVSSDEGKESQAQFLALTHNLLLVFNAKLQEEEAIVDRKVEDKFEKRYAEREKKAAARGTTLSPLIKQLRMATQLSAQFLRWLRNHLSKQASYSQSVRALRPLMEAYL